MKLLPQFNFVIFNGSLFHILCPLTFTEYSHQECAINYINIMMKIIRKTKDLYNYETKRFKNLQDMLEENNVNITYFNHLCLIQSLPKLIKSIITVSHTHTQIKGNMVKLYWIYVKGRNPVDMPIEI